MTTLSQTGGIVRDGFATIGEAAEFLKVSRTSIYRLFWSGSLPKRKVGGSTRIAWADLQKLVLTGC